MAGINKLHLYNSQTHKKELFIPRDNKVGIYVCGVTPYDITHLGHAFTYVFFDVLVRYLESSGIIVTYIQNITDVDDDLLKRALELNIDFRSLTVKNFSLFLSDLHWLNIKQPDYFPRATDHIREIIELNKKLEKVGIAYEKNGNLYFSIERYKNYGKLSGLSRQQMLPVANTRGNNSEDRNKFNPLDFVLWQTQQQGEPAWSSPWSLGRPGWHIECSAMSTKYLGNTIDIHGGGGDLIYPHHESEIAQSESVNKVPFARFFMHTSMLYYKGNKMSKSLNNMIFIKEFKEKYSANTIRLMLLKNQYRQKWEFNYELLYESQKLNELFRQVWIVESGHGEDLEITREQNDFYSFLNDDLNIPAAIKSLKVLAEKIIKNKEKSTSSAKAFLNNTFNILGLRIEY